MKSIKMLLLTILFSSSVIANDELTWNENNFKKPYDPYKEYREMTCSQFLHNMEMLPGTFGLVIHSISDSDKLEMIDRKLQNADRKGEYFLFREYLIDKCKTVKNTNKIANEVMFEASLGMYRR